LIFLLVIIYVAFISLGLPDSLLGSAWPTMYSGLNVSVASAGIISMTISGGTIISSLFSVKVINRFGIGLTTFVSVAMTATALLGFSYSNNFFMLCFWAIPLGLGAGSVDTGLNNFIALHYKAKHMSWLHCFWGVGASLGPIIMSYGLKNSSWNFGYRIIGIIQCVLVVILFASLPMWKKADSQKDKDIETKHDNLSMAKLISLPCAKESLIACFCYCAIEAVVGLWGTTYLTTVHGISAEVAAGWLALYYFGITSGRFVSGFLAIAFKNKQMIQLGQGLIAVGVVILFFPIHQSLILIAFFLIGLGCAPIFPSILHETPNTFGTSHSQAMIGLQMACAYIGSTFIPPIFGVIAKRTSYEIFSFCIGLILTVMILMIISLYKKIDAKNSR